MTVNGIEIDFDLDNRKDNIRFTKAFTEMQKKQEKTPVTDQDMEAFLNGCIKPEQVKELLKDGRISTLARVFVEFFSNAVDQYANVANAYKETADTLSDIKSRASALVKDNLEIQHKMESLTSDGVG